MTGSPVTFNLGDVVVYKVSATDRRFYGVLTSVGPLWRIIWYVKRTWKPDIYIAKFGEGRVTKVTDDKDLPDEVIRKSVEVLFDITNPSDYAPL